MMQHAFQSCLKISMPSQDSAEACTPLDQNHQLQLAVLWPVSLIVGRRAVRLGTLSLFALMLGSCLMGISASCSTTMDFHLTLNNRCLRPLICSYMLQRPHAADKLAETVDICTMITSHASL